jgi:hypothetical protein
MVEELAPPAELPELLDLLDLLCGRRQECLESKQNMSVVSKGRVFTWRSEALGSAAREAILRNSLWACGREG